MRKRALAFFICMTMLLTMFGQNYIPVIASSEPVLSSSVLYEGKVLRTLELPQNEKRTVTASSPAEMGDCSYQWQILADAEEELWVNISGQEAQSLEVSHALLTGILDDGAEAYLRCAVTAGEESSIRSR